MPLGETAKNEIVSQRQKSSPSRTIRTTTDPRPQLVKQVKTPFKLITIVPPMKDRSDMSNKHTARLESRLENRGKLDLTLLSRRPLSPISNCIPNSKTDNGIKSNPDPISRQERLISEPSKSDVLDFESIDERTLPMLIDSGEEATTFPPAVVSESSEPGTTAIPNAASAISPYESVPTIQPHEEGRNVEPNLCSEQDRVLPTQFLSSVSEIGPQRSTTTSITLWSIIYDALTSSTESTYNPRSKGGKYVAAATILIVFH